jgi:hypothetical protein
MLAASSRSRAVIFFLAAARESERGRQDQGQRGGHHRSGGTVEIASSIVERPIFTLSRLSWWRVFIPVFMAIFFSSAVSTFLLMPSISSSFSSP